MLQEIRGVHQWLAWESNVPRFQNLRGLSDGLNYDYLGVASEGLLLFEEQRTQYRLGT